MNESIKKITQWIKSHPWAAAGIGVVLVVIGYFVVKSTGGNPEGESLGLDNSQPSGTDEKTDPLAGLSGLGNAAGSMSPILPTPTQATPIDSPIFESSSPIGDIFESAVDYSGSYDDSYFPPTGGYSVGPTVTSESIISKATPASITTVKASAEGAAVKNSSIKAAAKPASVKTVKASTSGAAVKNSLSQASRSLSKPASIKTTTTTSSAKTATPSSLLSSIAPKKPATTTVNRSSSQIRTSTPVKTITTPKVIYTGPRPGYTWNGYAYIPNNDRARMSLLK